ncbi:MAG: hypothetical protein KH135_06090 [Firmicutes bacterium]|nr:hypothetical protein [Bacillota bacterium]
MDMNHLIKSLLNVKNMFQQEVPEKMTNEDAINFLVPIIEVQEDLFNRNEEEIKELNKKIKLLSGIVRNADTILKRIPKLNNTQKELFQSCFTKSENSDIKNAIKLYEIFQKRERVKKIVKLDSFLTIIKIILDKFDELNEEKERCLEIKSELKSIPAASKLLHEAESGKRTYFTKKEQELVLSVLMISSTSDISVSIAQNLFANLEFQKQAEEQQIKKERAQKKNKIKKVEIPKNSKLIVENPHTESEVIFMDNQSENKLHDQFEADKERYWFHLQHIEDMRQLPSCLPQKNYTNYREVMKFLLQKIKEELSFYNELSEKELDSDGRDEIDNQIAFLSNLFEEVKQEFASYYESEDGMDKVNESLSFQENHLFFIKKPSGTTFIESDLSSHEFTKERLEAIKTMIDELQKDTFKRDEKHFRKFTNNAKLNRHYSIYELKNYQTRLLFTYLGENNIAVLMAFCKKTDNSNSLLNTITNRILSCVPEIERLKYEIANETIRYEVEIEEELGKQIRKTIDERKNI